jgi:hypothetical protein
MQSSDFKAENILFYPVLSQNYLLQMITQLKKYLKKTNGREIFCKFLHIPAFGDLFMIIPQELMKRHRFFRIAPINYHNLFRQIVTSENSQPSTGSF